MNITKKVFLSTLSVAALMGLATSSASGTTLEIGGVTQNSSVTLTLSQESGTSMIMKDTAGFSKKTCLDSHLTATTTSPFTGSSVTGTVNSWSLKCDRSVTVHSPGKLEITYTSGTNGTVALEDSVITTSTVIGTVTCVTGTTTDIGTLTGVKEGHATIDISGITDCGIIPSMKWEGSYVVTSPTGLGVSK